MTYSIVARDPETGELGVAVQSHYFSVGPIVPWARPGVGAVATQSIADVSYGPRGLDLMASGLSAADALSRLTAEDEQAAVRQVAFVDAHGRVAAHTGSGCMAAAGDIQGEAVSCQANIMVTDRVWPAMLDAYVRAEGTMARRLLAALDAAEAQGGDLRGRQSAAMLVVPAAGESWETTVSLRVEDHPDPLVELARLVRLHEAYAIAGQGDERFGAGDHEQAATLFLRACELAPEADELRFWAAIGAETMGDTPSALDHLHRALAVQPAWRELLSRLSPDAVPAAPGLLAALERDG